MSSIFFQYIDAGMGRLVRPLTSSPRGPTTWATKQWRSSRKSRGIVTWTWNPNCMGYTDDIYICMYMIVYGYMGFSIL